MYYTYCWCSLQPGTFGFDSGNGCTECACGEASYETDSCDLISGQCACKPGVGGRACDVCEEGYWDYAPRGCRRKYLADNYMLD